MKKIGSFLLSAWFLSGVGVALLCLLTWFFGPIVGFGGRHPLEDELPREVLIGVMAVVWLTLNLRRMRKARDRDRKLIVGLAAPAVADPNATASAEELALLSERLTAALLALRGSKRRGLFGRSHLYELPWYMFIGPPGAGKTTALVNSGLTFPLEDSGKGATGIRGVGGTRNCDWWFTDQAVLIDTAGRYTTQDSQSAVDSAAWLGFLGMLKAHRRRQPVNGVLIAISLSDLATLTEAERLAHARTIKQRIRELHDQFAVRFPIYVLFTKADLIAGFVEFFSNLGKEEREQAWGMTFPVDDGREEGGAVAHYGAEFDLLIDRLNDRVLERVQQEPDIGNRSLIYGFPQQVASLREVAREFLEQIFRPSRLETRPLLRGVYFTSGTQNGTPIDRLLGAMSGQFGLQRQLATAFSGTGRSYFLQRLMQEVLFDEAGIVSADAKLEKRQKLIRRAAYATACVVLALLTGAWTMSFLGNQALILGMNARADTYDRQYAELAKRGGGENVLPPVLPALATLRTLPGGFVDREAGMPIGLGFGLYQGAKLGAQASNSYNRALNALLLPRLLSRLETQIQGNLGNSDFLYQALKVYLILGRQGPLDTPLITAWMGADFAASFPGDDQAPERNALTQHVSALIERPVTAVPLNGPLIEQVRAILRKTPLAQRSYARILGSEEVKALPAWRYSDHAGAAAENVLLLRSGHPMTSGVDGLYTWAGYHETLTKLLPEVTSDVAEDSWVLGRQDRVGSDLKQVEQLRRDVLGLYLDDYVRRWDTAIGDLQIKPFGSMSDGLDELNTLSGPNSPFRNVFQAFDAETLLSRETQGGRLEEAAGKTLGPEAMKEIARQTTIRQRRIGAMLGTVFTSTAPAVDPAQRVDEHFRWLHDFVGTPERPGQLEPVLQKMLQIYGSFSQVAASPNAAAALLGAASSNSGASLSQQLDTLGKSMPPAVQSMVRAVSQSSSKVTTAEAKQQIQDAWSAKVAPLCQAALSNRYPFVPGSATDVPMDDFVRLMAPGGLIDGFFTNTLKPFVDTTQTPWKWNSVDNSQLGLSANTLAQLEMASQIRNALFPGGGAAVSVKFEITPTSLDSQIGSVSLDLDGQDVAYSHGPTQPIRVQWPGPGGRNQARLTFVPLNGATVSITKEGPWALFRLLDGAKVAAVGQSDRLNVTFTGGGGTAAFLIAANSVINPFTLPALHQFRCPATL